MQGESGLTPSVHDDGGASGPGTRAAVFFYSNLITMKPHLSGKLFISFTRIAYMLIREKDILGSIYYIIIEVHYIVFQLCLQRNIFHFGHVLSCRFFFVSQLA